MLQSMFAIPMRRRTIANRILFRLSLFLAGSILIANLGAGFYAFRLMELVQ